MPSDGLGSDSSITGFAMPIDITLNVDDMAAALRLATERLVQSWRAGRRDAVWDKDSAISELIPHFAGSCGEIALAKILWVYCPMTVNNFSGMDPDLKLPNGMQIEVRARTSPTYELKVVDKDRDDRAYVLVRGLAPRLQAVGWLWGHEAKREEWRSNPGGFGHAFFVPDGALRPIEELTR